MITDNLRLKVITTVFVLASALTAHAEVKLPGFFTDHMVLQRDMDVPIWGWADPGEKISVSFAGQNKTATADRDGKWTVKLGALKTSAKGQILKVNNITISDILVGEVWVCSGQSNMEQTLAPTKSVSYGGVIDGEKVLAAANYPTLRHVKIAHDFSQTPKDNLTASWVVCTPQTAKNISATAFFFARAIQEKLDIPIGLIDTNWGGTPIEPWIPSDVKAVSGLINPLNCYCVCKGKKPKKAHHYPSVLYNSMICPLVPFAIRGAIWYQGESNGSEGDTYLHKMNALISGWRKMWKQGDFPFYYVQLASYANRGINPEGGEGWAGLREAQLKSLAIKNTGMAVATDIGDTRDIHPRNKQDVGKRLAAWALVKDYGVKDMACSGPIYKSMAVRGTQIHIKFDHANKGLMVGKKEGCEPVKELNDEKLKGFSIAGQDRKWVWAEAQIGPNGTVVVSSPNVIRPVAVRYGFTLNPALWGCNLYNKEGLPASPFRTDQWRLKK